MFRTESLELLSRRSQTREYIQKSADFGDSNATPLPTARHDSNGVPNDVIDPDDFRPEVFGHLEGIGHLRRVPALKAPDFLDLPQAELDLPNRTKIRSTA